MPASTFDVAVIGGGAAGFFGALCVAEANPNCSIVILEKTTKLLAKVKISGGGRCNVTHACFEPTPLARHYPRGSKELKTLFRHFQAKDVVDWFAGKGVALKIEADGRMFPATNQSQTIIDCFLAEAERLGIQIRMQSEVTRLHAAAGGWQLTLTNGNITARHVLVATGGYPRPDSYDWLRPWQPVIAPVPSLFTFNDSKMLFRDLMGVAVAQAEIKIAGTSFSETGPVLITHWGLSGPAVIKLSAWAARWLRDQDYTFTALVNWSGTQGEEALRQDLRDRNVHHGRQRIAGHPLHQIPVRLWERLCTLAEIDNQRTWAELPRKNLNRLVEYVIRCPFEIRGKTTFKEEFVTCGGIDLASIDLTTMQSKTHQGIYFAGEVLNIDGETGGFNFQAAWTTAWLAARAIARN